MLFVSDESGSFDLAHAVKAPSLWVTIAIPPSSAKAIREQVAAWCQEWEVDELHAVALAPHQRGRMAAWLSSADFVWKATGTARDLMSAEVAEGWRDDQAENFLVSFGESEARGTMDSRYVGRGDELHRMMIDRRRVPPTAFLQYGIVAGRHFADIVQAAVRRYGGAEHAADWAERALILDGKGQGRHGGPRFMAELLYPILATIPLDVPASIPVGHPLAKLRTGMKISELFGGDPRFVDDSSTEPLIQVADLIAWMVRRRLTHPHEAEVKAAYELLLRRCPEIDDLRVRMMWRNGHQPKDPSRYAALLL